MAYTVSECVDQFTVGRYFLVGIKDDDEFEIIPFVKDCTVPITFVSLSEAASFCKGLLGTSSIFDAIVTYYVTNDRTVTPIYAIAQDMYSKPVEYDVTEFIELSPKETWETIYQFIDEHNILDKDLQTYQSISDDLKGI